MVLPETESAPASGFTRYVTHREFQQYCDSNDRDHDKIMVALWGRDGRDGLVQSVNEIKTYQKVIIGIILFIEPVVLAVMLRWLGI